MITAEHQCAVDCIKLVPALVNTALGLAKCRRLAGELRLHPSDLVAQAEGSKTEEHKPEPPWKELHADVIVAGHDEQGKVAEGCVVEVQKQEDANKEHTWPLSVTLTRHNLRCARVPLLVVTFSKAAERWARTPIALDERNEYVPAAVVGPGNVPLITQRATARGDLHLTLLSAIVNLPRLRDEQDKAPKKADRLAQESLALFSAAASALAVLELDLLAEEHCHRMLGRLLSPLARARFPIMAQEDGFDEVLDKIKTAAAVKGQTELLVELLMNRFPDLNINKPELSEALNKADSDPQRATGIVKDLSNLLANTHSTPEQVKETLGIRPGAHRALGERAAAHAEQNSPGRAGQSGASGPGSDTGD